MKVMLTIDFPPEIGGIQQYLFDRVIHLFNENDYVLAGVAPSTAKDTPKLPCKFITGTTPFSILNKKWSLLPLFFILLVIIMRNKRVTIESGNVYSAIPAFVLNLIFKRYSYSVYCYGKELLPLKEKTLKSFFLRVILNRASTRYVLTNFTLQILRKAGIRGNCIITPPRIDIATYNTSIIRSKNTALHLLSVGRLVAHKGHVVLVNAVSQLPSSISWQLTIAGMGPEYKQLIKTICDLSLTEKVTIKGSLTNEQIIDEYNQAGLFIFPSLENADGVEGFGIVLLEAMALKVPIIATNTGGIPEVLGSHCGLVIPAGDTLALCNAIQLLYNDPQLCETFKENGAKRVKEHFSWN